MTTSVVAAPARPRAAEALRPFNSVLYYTATVGEWAGLGAWLLFIDMGRFWTAIACLIGGFAIERVSVLTWIRTLHAPGLAVNKTPLMKTLAGFAFATAVEIAIWHTFRTAAAAWSVEIAGVLLFLMIHPLHAIELGGVTHQPAIKFILRGRTILFSFIEASGGTLWLASVRMGHWGAGLAVLVVALFLEHFHQAQEFTDDGFRV